MTTTSASAASLVASYPACSSSPAIRSESCPFIWQPNVSMRYFLATLSTFAFRPFAFAPPAAAPRGALPQHLTRRAPETIGNRFAAQHPRQLFHASGFVESEDGRPRASPL